MAEISNPEALAVGIADMGCIRFGEITLRAGNTAPVYFNLRGLGSIDFKSAHSVKKQLAIREVVVSAYGEQLERFDDYHHIMGVPLGAMTITGMITHPLKQSALQLTKGEKAHGLADAIYGNWHPGEKVVLIDDVISSGTSVMEVNEQLETTGLQASGAAVLIDRQAGGREKLLEQGFRVEAAIGVKTIIEVLAEQKLLNRQQLQIMRGHFLGEN